MPEHAAASQDDRPRVSVLVNNYNYGHFLGACLDSVAAQTVAPHEVIVVDDGSTDGSRSVLEARDGLRVIYQENRGQAGAMNTGFQAASGDLVLFLDADDQLRPRAIEVITRLWTGAMAGLSYRLDKIGADGVVTGHYEMEVPDDDLLPQMLDHLTMPFMPTSGNVFSKAALAWAFPLPEPRWRISADALLVRAAMLSGPMRHIRQTLGEYRVHGGNNYHREDAAWSAQIQRGILDIADVGIDLVTLADQRGFELRRGDRAKLLFAAMTHRVRAEAQAEDPSGFRAFLDRLVAACPSSRDPRLRALLQGARLTLPRWPMARRVVADARQCSDVSAGLLRWAMGAELRAAVLDAQPPRPPYAGPPTKARHPNMQRLLTGPEWVRDYSDDGGYDLCAERARFSLPLPVQPQQTLRVTLAPLGAEARPVRILADGEPVLVTWITGETTVDIPVPVPTPGAWRPTRLDLLAPSPGGRSRRFGKSRTLIPRLRVKHMSLFASWRPPSRAVLPVLSEQPFSELGPSLEGADLDQETPEQIDPGDVLHLAIPPLPTPFALGLRFSPAQPEGELQVLAGGETLFTGEIGPAARIVMRIPAGYSHASQGLALSFVFKPKAFLDGPALFPIALGWLPGGADGRFALPKLRPGAWVSGANLHRYLGGGWEADEAGALRMSGPTAELSVSAQGKLILDLTPVSPLAEEAPVVLVVAVDGVETARLRLVGRGRVEADLPASEDPVEVSLHAAGEGPEGRADEDHGGVILLALGLASQPEDAPVPVPRRPDHVPDLAMLVARIPEAGPSEAITLRAELDQTIASTRPSALWHCLSGADLEAFCDLADLAGPSKPPPLEAGEGWLRGLARAMLAGPACATWPEPVAAAPPVARDLSRAFARFLVRDPPWGLSKSALSTHQDHLVARFAEARRDLAEAPLDSARYALAREMLDGYRGRALLFSDLDLKPHVTAFGAALEAHLLREGHDLGLDRPPRATGRARIGILVLETGPSPEIAIARAMMAAIPGTHATRVLILADSEAGDDLGADQVLGLKDCSVADCVGRIRALQLDTLVVGTLPEGAGLMAQVVAHRLAPRQVAMSAIWPTTTGFASFDTFVMGDTVTPKPARGDYSESTVVAPGTGQSFAFPKPAYAPANRAEIRRRLGADDDTVVLVSSAMMDKISPEALAAWMRILAAAPEAILVLYPFAPNWKRDYNEALFEQRLARACAKEGVARRQIRVLPAIPGQVPNILSAGDLYLDSFPYSGATTVIEALSAGLPVIARKGRTQRGHQAAGWLMAYGFPELITGSEKAYVDTATRLIQSPQDLARLAKQVGALPKPLGVDRAHDTWLAEWLVGEVDQDPDAYRYFFRHIAKTGGTSLRQIFCEWFDVLEDYHGPWDVGSSDPAPDLADVDPGQMVVGHYRSSGLRLYERYPDLEMSGNWRLLSFVRDPLDMALSDYHFVRLNVPDLEGMAEGADLEDYVQTWQGSLSDWLECDETNWREALDRYWFIGTLERFDDCISYLSEALGKPRPKVTPFENATHRGAEPNPADVEIFRKNNALDFEIYAEISRRLDARLGPKRCRDP